MINADKPDRWKEDVHASVELYNSWFLDAAPAAYRCSRLAATARVKSAFVSTADHSNITPRAIVKDPSILPVLRMSTAPPIARDRLTGLAHTPTSLLHTLERGSIPPRMRAGDLEFNLARMCATITNLLDVDLFPWLTAGTAATAQDREMAAIVVSDRLCGAQADPIIRNAQEQRQLALIETWLTARGYKKKSHPPTQPLTAMEPGTFWFRMNVVITNDGGRQVKIPIDAVIQPHKPASHRMPILVEAKSAGDFTNTNKRRKEEATKIRQLRATHGDEISLLLFLCGYFDAGYLGYEASEGLDWVWEHRIDELADAGL